ncbi:hypothetical protein GX50_04951 [[Emmonsia] crescens]|uniref:Uncharacterized protein n=1 Tax=[Emmonsia] crescens TaxID=73230 RepID=A0A2B7Z7B4_9EURO|nr:hypothetical protein GX50_04951 [Emmonsia crescens]
MADYRSPTLQIPHRKPINSGNAGLQFHSSGSPNPQHRQQQAMRPQSHQNRPQVASSSYHPNQMHPQQQMPPAFQPQQPQQPQHYQQPQHMNPNYPVRRASNATTSTTSTGGNGPLPPGHPNAHADIRRSSSSRSGHAPNGYVALMRKQKATVWCDRAQQEDPRVAAQRRAAKQRAAIEVHGGGGRSATLASTGKIRHNTSSRSMSYNTGTMVGAGVPLRLSANEIGDGEDDVDNDGSPFHRRTGSGRSSTGSNRFPSGYQRQQQGRFSSSSNSNTPPNMDSADRIQTDIPEIVETPAPLKPDEEKDYFASSNNNNNNNTGANGSVAAVNPETANKDKPKPGRPSSTHSYSGELEEDFGTVSEMAAPSGALAASNRGKKVDDLKRRGSVDDRSTSMSNVRLFVANPDLSD